MTEQARERKTKVLCNVNCYVETSKGEVQKIPAGSVVLMTTAEIKHFGKSVTKDTPDDANEVKRI